MALTNFVPNGGERFYAYYNGSTMNTINNVISWSDALFQAGDTYLIEYSKNSGSTWTTIGATISSTEQDGGIATNRFYYWCLSSGQFTAIVGSDHYLDTVRIRVTNNTHANTSTSAADLSVYEVPIINILPNSTTNTEPIFYKSQINITWDLSYIDSETVADLYYRKKEGSGAYGDWTILRSDVALQDGHYVWEPTTLNGAYTVQLKFVGVAYDTVVAYSENDDAAVTGFTITNNLSTIYYPTTPLSKYPDRTEIGTKVAIEKANIVDEAIALGQLEARGNLKITQRDQDGLDEDGYNRSGIAAADPAAAFNVIWEPLVETANARDVHGYLDFTADGDGTATAVVVGDYKYGSRYYIDISHGLDLGNYWGTLYTNQTINSLQFSAQQITALDNHTKPAMDVALDWEALDENTIRVYCTVKGTALDKTVPQDSLDSKVKLAKDRLGEAVGTYFFEYTIKEVLA